MAARWYLAFSGQGGARPGWHKRMLRLVSPGSAMESELVQAADDERDD
jgi:hypothetical protein